MAFEEMLARVFGERMQTEDDLCKEIWSALANVTWYHPKSYLEAGYSFRAAGGLIAAIRGGGDYMDWYCCGPYAFITDEIRRSFRKEGWIPDEYPEVCDEPGCLKDAGCGWYDGSKYRITCGKHTGKHMPRTT